MWLLGSCALPIKLVLSQKKKNNIPYGCYLKPAQASEETSVRCFLRRPLHQKAPSGASMGICSFKTLQLHLFPSIHLYDARLGFRMHQNRHYLMPTRFSDSLDRKVCSTCVLYFFESGKSPKELNNLGASGSINLEASWCPGIKQPLPLVDKKTCPPIG